MDGALYKAKSGRKLHGYLFNDLLILAEPMKSLSNKGYLYSLYREPMPVGKITVRQQSTMTLKPTFGTNNSGKRKENKKKTCLTHFFSFFFKKR
jgi:hypothetical protein